MQFTGHFTLKELQKEQEAMLNNFAEMQNCNFFFYNEPG